MNVSVRSLLCATPILASSLTLLTTSTAYADPPRRGTTTPIEHVIVIVGENHTFDNVYGTYQPKAGQHIDNLLSEGIVECRRYAGAALRAGRATDRSRPAYLRRADGVDRQLRASAAALDDATRSTNRMGVLDTRFPADLPNGPFQISKYVPYAEYTGDPVHRFFQMWQDVDGGQNDKFVWVEETIGTGSNGQPVPPGGFNPMEGAISMGFYNMNPFVDAKGNAQPGDAPMFKQLADTYAMQRQLSPGRHGRHRRELPGVDHGLRRVLHRPGRARRQPRGAVREPDREPGSARRHEQLLHAGRLRRRLVRELRGRFAARSRGGGRGAQGAEGPASPLRAGPLLPRQ